MYLAIHGNMIVLFVALFLLSWVAIILCNETSSSLSASTRLNLSKDGVELKRDIISEEQRRRWKGYIRDKQYKRLKGEMRGHPGLKRIVESLGKDYLLQDYIWVIEKSAVHTCHRDNNGTFFNPGQQHPSYTMIVYLEEMDKCLGVIPQSHLSKYAHAASFTNKVKDVVCSKGDVIVFNANLIHTGAFNKRDDNLRVQMKISHRDDLGVLSYYQDFNKVLNKENTNPKWMRKIQHGLSCRFPIVSDMTQRENIKSARGTDEGATISIGQKLFSYVFYGRSDFYNLPNAF